MKNNILFIMILIVIFFLGVVVGYYKERQPVTIEKTVIKWQDKIVYRDYKKMEYSEAMKELMLYDTSEPRLNIYQIKNDEIKADVGLHKRNWSGTAKIKVNQESNFNYYVGVGAICFAAGIILMEKIK